MPSAVQQQARLRRGVPARAGQIDSHNRGQPALLPERGAPFRPLERAGRRQLPCPDPGRRRRPDLPDICGRGPRPPAPRRDDTTGSVAAGTPPCLPRPSRPRVPGSQGIPARHQPAHTNVSTRKGRAAASCFKIASGPWPIRAMTCPFACQAHGMGMALLRLPRPRRQLMSPAKVGTVGPVNGRSHERADRYR